MRQAGQRRNGGRSRRSSTAPQSRQASTPSTRSSTVTHSATLGGSRRTPRRSLIAHLRSRQRTPSPSPEPPGHAKARSCYPTSSREDRQQPTHPADTFATFRQGGAHARPPPVPKSGMKRYQPAILQAVEFHSPFSLLCPGHNHPNRTFWGKTGKSGRKRYQSVILQDRATPKKFSSCTSHMPWPHPVKADIMWQARQVGQEALPIRYLAPVGIDNAQHDHPVGGQIGGQPATRPAPGTRNQAPDVVKHLSG